MDKEKLNNECSRLFNCDRISDSVELLDIYSEFLFQAIMNHDNMPVHTDADTSAKLIIQMMLTKTLHLKGIVKGISYEAKDGRALNEIIDPTIVASLIRNVYETVGIFNLIYRSTKNSDEKTIIYCLWVHSGLKYRQRFDSAITTIKNKEKIKLEKQQLDELVQIIENTLLYKSLDETNQKKVKSHLKDKRYLMMFNNNEVILLDWQKLSKVIGDDGDVFENVYSYFSFYSHPSNVSVFQFADMFRKGDQSFLQLTNINLKIFFILSSVFIADYIKLFPIVQETFESLCIRDQIVINYHNTLLRGQDYSINDA